ncbi:MAG: hypothetical protein WHU10_13065, partial [Fimbriimonadales bacterium]
MMKTPLVAMALLAAGTASAVTIDFELLSTGSNAGNLYAAQGVLFSYGAVTAGLNVGDTVVLPSMTQAIYGSKGPLAWSPTTVGYAPGTADLLMTFSTPVTYVSLLTDRYSPESGETVQLAALDAGIDATIEWQWDGGHVPGEVLGNSFALWVDMMY